MVVSDSPVSRASLAFDILSSRSRSPIASLTAAQFSAGFAH
jgi:hypothetical protein